MERRNKVLLGILLLFSCLYIGLFAKRTDAATTYVVNDENELQTFTDRAVSGDMILYAKWEQGEEKQEPAGAVKTGDSFSILPFVILIVVSIVVVGVIFYMKKRNEDD